MKNEAYWDEVYKKSAERFFLRHEVFKKYNYSCADCGIKNVSFEVHHIIPKCEGGVDEINNLVPLCVKCHNKTKIYGVWTLGDIYSHKLKKEYARPTKQDTRPIKQDRRDAQNTTPKNRTKKETKTNKNKRHPNT